MVFYGHPYARNERPRCLPPNYRDLGTERPWIAALTAAAMKENCDECLAAGVDDFLTKPSNAQELQEALERCFERLETGTKYAGLPGEPTVIEV